MQGQRKNREEIGTTKVLHDYAYVLENYLWGLGRERIDQKWGKDFGGHYSGIVERELKTEWQQ